MNVDKKGKYYQSVFLCDGLLPPDIAGWLNALEQRADVDFMGDIHFHNLPNGKVMVVVYTFPATEPPTPDAAP